MAFRKRRRRIRTTWELAPQGLSLASREKVVTTHALRNLAVGTVPTGTLAVFPIPLELGYDDLGGASVNFLTEGGVESRTLLRLVGMVRPIGLIAKLKGNTPAASAAHEVRYALYRGNTSQETADFSATTGATQDPSLAQPDLFSSSGLANERIAWMRSFMLPGEANTLADMQTFQESVAQTLPWHKDASLSVIDFKSKRVITTDSRFWMLKQVRLCTSGAPPIFGNVDDVDLDDTATFFQDASFARLLMRKVSA